MRCSVSGTVEVRVYQVWIGGTNRLPVDSLKLRPGEPLDGRPMIDLWFGVDDIIRSIDAQEFERAVRAVRVLTDGGEPR